MTAEKNSSFTIKGVSIVHYIIVALFCFAFRFVPGFAGITPTGMGILGCFIGAVYGWSTIGMIWPSIVSMIGTGLIIGMDKMASMTFGNSIIVVMMFMFPAMSIITTTGAMDYLVNKVLTNKLTVGKPWMTIFVLILGCGILCTLNSIIVLVIFCSFFANVCKQVGIKPYTKLPTFMMLGLALSASLGQVVIPFMGQGMALIGSYKAIAGAYPNFAMYILFSAPMMLIMVIAYVLMMRFIFRVDASPFANLTEEMLGESPKCTRDQKIALGFFLAMLVTILVSVLPVFGPIYRFCGMFGLCGIGMVLAAVLQLIKKEDGSQIFDFATGARDMSWDALLLTALVLLMSTCMSLPETGIAAAVASVITPFMSLPPMVFIIVVLAIIAVITNVANNMVCAIIGMPFLYNYALTIGMDPTGVMVLLFMMAQFAIATPGASALAGICFAQTELVKAPDMMKYGVMVVPLLIVIGLTCGLVLNTLIF